MEPEVLEDIQAIERLQDEDILMAGVDYSATRRYAECLHRALAAWNERQRSYLLTEDLEAIEQWRMDISNGITRREWNPVLLKFWPFVWGSQGYGLIAETGDATGVAPISFWHRPEIDWNTFLGVLLEATTMAAHIKARGPGDKWEVVARMGGEEAAFDGELSENFCRLSHKARETVEREARQVMSAPLPAKPAQPAPAVLPPAPEPKRTTRTKRTKRTQTKPPAPPQFPSRLETETSALDNARAEIANGATRPEACLAAFRRFKDAIDHHSLFRKKDGSGFSVQAMIAALKRQNKARQQKAAIAARRQPVPARAHSDAQIGYRSLYQ